MFLCNFATKFESKLKNGSWSSGKQYGRVSGIPMMTGDQTNDTGLNLQEGMKTCFIPSCKCRLFSYFIFIYSSIS